MSGYDPDYCVLDRLESFLRQYVAYPNEHAIVAHVLWNAHTHLMQYWDISPRLAFMSEQPASGKSRALEMTRLFAANPVYSINATPAYISRKIAESGGDVTLIYDEIDALFGNKRAQDANREIVGIVNGGYERGATVGRVKGGSGTNHETEELPAFAPVAMGGLGSLPYALETRTIKIQMQRRAPDEKLRSWRKRDEVTAKPMRDDLVAWGLSIDEALTDHDPEMPEGVEDRAADCWHSLLAIADMAGGPWPEAARAAAVYFTIDQSEDAGEVELLLHIKEAFFVGEDYLWTSTLLDRLHRRDESPWNDIRGKPLDGRGLAKRLKGYGIRPKDIKSGANTVRKGYYLSDFRDAFSRYLKRAATVATAATDLNNNDNLVAPVASGSACEIQPATTKVNGHNGVAPVALVAHKCESDDLDYLDLVAHYEGEGLSRDEAEWRAARELE